VLNQIITDLIHRVALDCRALSRLSHHPRSFPMTERDSFDSFFLFSNFARQRVRLCKSLREGKKSRRATRSDERGETRRVTVSIWYDFYSRLDDLFGDRRSKFRSRRFHVRINTIRLAGLPEKIPSRSSCRWFPQSRAAFEPTVYSLYANISMLAHV